MAAIDQVPDQALVTPVSTPFCVSTGIGPERFGAETSHYKGTPPSTGPAMPRFPNRSVRRTPALTR